jgi:hypothetical protein
VRRTLRRRNGKEAGSAAARATITTGRLLGLATPALLLDGLDELPQFQDRAPLDLAHALARDAENDADLLEGARVVPVEPEPQAQDPLLARGEAPEEASDVPALELAERPVGGVLGARAGEDLVQEMSAHVLVHGLVQ